MFHFLFYLTIFHFLGHPVCYYYTLFEYFYVSWSKGTQKSEPNKLETFHEGRYTDFIHISQFFALLTEFSIFLVHPVG